MSIACGFPSQAVNFGDFFVNSEEIGAFSRKSLYNAFRLFLVLRGGYQKCFDSKTFLLVAILEINISIDIISIKDFL
ncbi:hypothetical protein DPV80_02340 [Haemophilus sputorum]|uniref:Uncharacterized protein n=1 Tax=Haemophilus sputorum TaxID=1078480 RepID=A0ABX9HW64_9PAST|nr:hypothetical protein DPV80_02340 [Haemophilus sputorum]RDF12391.1 hypothetical protein DPV84_02340 [Haemophilus sputorum]